MENNQDDSEDISFFNGHEEEIKHDKELDTSRMLRDIFFQAGAPGTGTDRSFRNKPNKNLQNHNTVEAQDLSSEFMHSNVGL